MSNELKFVLKNVFLPILSAVVIGYFLGSMFELSESQTAQRLGTILISIAIYMEYRVLKYEEHLEYREILEIVIFVCLILGTILTGYGDIIFDPEYMRSLIGY